RSFSQLQDELPPDRAISRMGVEQSNTSIVYAERLIVKLFRRLQGGTNPDLEIGLHLTERAGFPRVPAVAGWFEYVAPGTQPSTLAMMQQFVRSHGDGWRHALGAVGRFYDEIGDAAVPEGLDRGTMIELEPPD